MRIIKRTEQLASTPDKTDHRQVEVEVLSRPGAQLMFIRGLPGGERQIPISSEGAASVVRDTSQRSLMASSLLLLLGLLLAALFSHRISRPLQALVRGAEAIGQGQLHHRLPEDGPGELRELQAAFNRMAAQLAQLEQERQRWQSREHLAELGELARGLAHTLRNPLHTLGLVLEELAQPPQRLPDEQRPDEQRPDEQLLEEQQQRQELKGQGRAQLRRVDRWLRSFLAVGAGSAAQPEPVELNSLLQSLVLETLQQDRQVTLQLPDEPITVRAVPLALSAALSNLLDNACQALPASSPPVLSLSRRGQEAVIELLDFGPGVPEQVRLHLFQPHQTTRAGGSGMGLFLSHQLIVTGLGGRLSLQPMPEGGTRAEVCVPLDVPLEGSTLGATSA
ncbi:MAG: ATP-binding protein [Myxococcota bacterium]